MLLFVRLTDNYESAMYDRTHLYMSKCHSDLIDVMTSINPNIVVVLFGGSPVAMPWLSKVNTLLNAYLPGEAGGEALYNIIFGKVNPSGKLAETYPIKNEDNIVSEYFPMGPKNVEYRESIFVGYRYFDTAEKNVLFPFGYGLSYTKFEYEDLKIDGLNVSYTIKNVGDKDGYEISQLYVSDPNPIVFKATKELKGFEKTFIKKGESVRVTHTLDYRSFAFYNTLINDWYAQNGEYEILIGASSRDIKLTGKIDVKFDQSEKKAPDYKSICPAYYDIAHLGEIPNSDFSSLYGADIPENKASRRGYFDYNTTIGEMKVCLIGKIIVKVAPSIIKSQVPNADITTMMMLQQGMEEMPLRGLIGISSGLIHHSLVAGMLMWGNKKYFRGFFKFMGGIFGTLGNLLRKKTLEKQRREGKSVMVNDIIKEIKQNEKEKKAAEKEKKKLAEKETKLIEKNEKREEKLAKKNKTN